MAIVDRTTQKENIASMLPDNTLGLITPEDHRVLATDQADSAVFEIDDFKDEDIKDKIENLTDDERLLSEYVKVDVENFSSNLSVTDTNPQICLETIDELDVGGHKRRILIFSSLNQPYIVGNFGAYGLMTYFQFTNLEKFYISGVKLYAGTAQPIGGLFARLRESGTTTDYFSVTGETLQPDNIKQVTLSADAAMPLTGSSLIELQVATPRGSIFFYSMTLELTER